MSYESYMYIAKWKQSIWEGYMPYDFNYIKFWIKQYYGYSKKVSGSQDLECKE